MFKLVFLLVCIIVSKWSVSFAFTSQLDLQIERFEQVCGEQLMNSTVRVRKYNRTTYSINGTWNLLVDLDDSFEMAIHAAYSSLGNNQFNEYPMKVPRKKFCQFLAEDYIDYQYVWANKTNLPHLEKGSTYNCPLPKKEYWVHDLVPIAAWVPPVIPTGYWRLTSELWSSGTDQKMVVQYHYYFKVSRRLPA